PVAALPELLLEIAEELLIDRASEAARRGDAELAGVRARARGHIGDRVRERKIEAKRAEVIPQRGKALARHPAQEHVLLDGEPDRVAHVLARDRGEPAKLYGRDVSERQEDRHDRIARLRLRIDVAAMPDAELGRKRRIVEIELAALVKRAFLLIERLAEHRVAQGVIRKSLALFEDEAAKLLEAELLEEELHARSRAVLLLAEAREDACDGLRERKHLVDWHEVREELRLLRHRAEPASDEDLEAAFLSPIHVAHRGDRADVVDRGERAGLLLAAGEGDLEFASEALRVGMPQEVARHRSRIRRDIEYLRSADTGNRAAGDVADRVAARLLRRHADVREPPEDIRRVEDVHEVELHVLSSRDVDDAVGVFLGEIGEPLHLLGGDPAHRDFDPPHLGVRLAFAVRPAAQQEPEPPPPHHLAPDGWGHFRVGGA